MAIVFVGTLGGVNLGRIELVAPIVAGDMPETPSVSGSAWSC